MRIYVAAAILLVLISYAFYLGKTDQLYSILASPIM